MSTCQSCFLELHRECFRLRKGRKSPESKCKSCRSKAETERVRALADRRGEASSAPQSGDQKCTFCGSTKSLAEFVFNKTKDQHTNQCKDCRKNYIRRYRSGDRREEILATEKLGREKHKDTRRRCDERYQRNNRAKILAQKKAYRQKNFQRIAELGHAWYLKHKDDPAYQEYQKDYRRRRAEKHKQYARQYYLEHREHLRALGKQASRLWAAANKQRLNAATRNRRARIRKSEGKHSAQDIANLYVAQEGLCAACLASIEPGFEVDHIMPIALGGRNSKENLQLLCAPCNRSKGALHPDEWRSRVAAYRNTQASQEIIT
jgi:5-methylcytosine-specific restriction endonuclease McrA